VHHFVSRSGSPRTLRGTQGAGIDGRHIGASDALVAASVVAGFAKRRFLGPCGDTVADERVVRTSHEPIDRSIGTSIRKSIHELIIQAMA
jgi:hypothetical protein